MSAFAWRAGLPALWIGTTVAAFFGAWARLPDPMASHWGAGGLPDGSMPRAAVACVHLVVAIAAAIGVALVRPSSGASAAARSGSAITMTFVGTLFTTIGVLTVRANAGVAHWTAARPIGWATAGAALVIPVAVTALAAWRWRRAGGPFAAPFPNAPSVGLGAGERAVWTGAARSGVFAVTGVVAVAAVLFGWSALPKSAVLTAAVLGPVALALARVVVRVDERGVRIAYGPFGWPRQRLPLDRVVGARAIDVVPLANGGWGYRGSLLVFGRAAIVLRGGEGIELSLRGGKSLVVTVDDATTGAGLVNDLLARAGAAKMSDET